jgi:polyisoprenoid-binding protein YceI
MKSSMVLRKIPPLFFMLFFIISCKDSAGQKSGTKNDKNSAASPGKIAVQKWNANASSAQIKFSVKGPFGTVHGNLSGLKSTILFDKDNLAVSSIRASSDPKTISTGIRLRNRDLQKEKYLDSDNFPSISFYSDKIQKSGTDYKAIGDLTIKGVTKRIEIPFSFSEKGNAGVFKGSFTIQRRDYGVGKPGGSIGNTITIDLEVSVSR